MGAERRWRRWAACPPTACRRCRTCGSRRSSKQVPARCPRRDRGDGCSQRPPAAVCRRLLPPFKQRARLAAPVLPWAPLTPGLWLFAITQAGEPRDAGACAGLQPLRPGHGQPVRHSGQGPGHRCGTCWGAAHWTDPRVAALELTYVLRDCGQLEGSTGRSAGQSRAKVGGATTAAA